MLVGVILKEVIGLVGGVGELGNGEACSRAYLALFEA